MADKIRVMVVDDHDMVRKGLATFLRTQEDLELVGEASSGQDALLQCEHLQPDVVLMDLIMPEMGGVEAHCRLAQSATCSRTYRSKTSPKLSGKHMPVAQHSLQKPHAPSSKPPHGVLSLGTI
jgi:CheY-like chemotaxis protein